MGLASCTGDELSKEAEVVAGTSGIKTITATVANYGPMTRSELYREDNDINFRWSVGDVLGIFPDKGDQVSFTIDENQAGSLTATFDGGAWALKVSHTYHVYFPHVYENRDMTAIPMDYTGQKQIGKNTYSHLGKYDYLATDAVTPTGPYLNFTMYHQGSAMLLKIKAAEAGTFTSMTLTADNNVFTTKAELDISGETPVVTATEQSNNITLQLQGVTTSSADEEFTLSMMTLPVDLTSETLSVFLTRDDGTIFSGYIEEPKNIEQGKPYEMTTELTIGGAVSDDWIEFADEEVKAICVANWDTNGDGELSYKEAAAVTDIGNKFLGKTKIKSFDEFQYFTGVQSVQERAFQACVALESIVLPNSLTATSGYMFNGCTSLTNVTIPESIRGINYYSFNNCSKLSSIALSEDLTSIGGGAFSGCSSLTSITLPDCVKSIGYSAFNGCSGLTSITLPNGLTTIRSWTFQGCSNLTSITLPEGITSIEDGTFSGCSSLTSITLPEGITTIEGSAFSDCSSLTSITLPEGITSIGGSTFSGCSSLTSITIPDGVTSIGEGSFQGCSSLTSITLPNGIISIGSGVFSGCSSLTNITLPESITSIGESAFDGCSSLSSITLPEDITSISDNVFNGCSNLISITLPEELTTIGVGAFQCCSSLSSITLPENLTSIGAYAFSRCSSLTSITLPEKLSSIGEFAFSGCSSLSSIILPDGIQSIVDGVFNGCTSLTSITLSEGLASIGSSAFYSCTNLKNITLPESITSIGYNTFSYCNSLTTITCLASTPPALDGLGYQLDSLTTIYVPAESVATYKTSAGWSAYADRIFGIGDENDDNEGGDPIVSGTDPGGII